MDWWHKMEPRSVAEYLAHFKYPVTPGVEALLGRYGPNPGSNLFKTVTLRNNPAPGDEIATGWWYETVAAQLCARGLLYVSSVSGNSCTGGAPLPRSSAAAAGVGSAGSLARVGISSVGAISSVGGPASLGFAAAGTALSSVLGYATLGLGLALGPLMAIIQHHGQAVQAEDNTICSVATSANQIIPQIDQAVASGSITAGQGIQAMVALVTQLNVQLQTVSGKGSGGHPCNAGCVYQAWLKAHLDFSNTFYVDLSPMTQKQLPVAPGTYAPNAASAPIVSALASSRSAFQGSPQVFGSTANDSSSNLNAAGSQNGTFSTIPNVLTVGTGTEAPGTMPSSMWIVLIAVAVLGGALILHRV